MIDYQWGSLVIHAPFPTDFGHVAAVGGRGRAEDMDGVGAGSVLGNTDELGGSRAARAGG